MTLIETLEALAPYTGEPVPLLLLSWSVVRLELYLRRLRALEGQHQAHVEHPHPHDTPTAMRAVR